MEKFEIKLKSNNNIFTAGDTVYGFIYLFLKDSIKAKSIKLLIFGKIDTKWTYSDGKSYIRYRGEDSYVKLEFIIWNGAEHGDTLNPGEHQFPFNFTIPQYCPFSFEGKYGQIHYFFKAEIDRPWRLNSKAELTFVVKPQVDLNQIPDIGRPVIGCIDDDLGVKFFSNGKVDAKITLLKSGYICGEAITPNISITNSSTKSIQKIEISLEQFILCRAKAFGKVSIENDPPPPYEIKLTIDD
uniref:Arrestin-like N-terminal domain-containing protein n=1 Tax=Acrobeloides nanus TaxID=290746 RepID=A0A914EBF3_9BILA